jgi:CheY-like chemotaxis protein
VHAQLLVVDDEAVNREIIAEYLEAEGCELTMAADGTQALDLLRAADAAFDAVVLDRMMPDWPARKAAHVPKSLYAHCG